MIFSIGPLLPLKCSLFLAHGSERYAYGYRQNLARERTPRSGSNRATRAHSVDTIEANQKKIIPQPSRFQRSLSYF